MVASRGTHPRDDGCPVSTTSPVTHVELIAKNRRTSLIMLAIEFLLIGILGAAIGILVTRSVPVGILIGAAIAIVVDIIGWLLAVRATIALTHAVEVTPEQAKVLHDVIEGLCIRTGLPKPTRLHRRRSRAQRVRVRALADELRASPSRPACSTSCRGASSKACSRTRCRTSATATCRSRRSRSRPSASSSRSRRSRPARAGSPTGATTTTATARSLLIAVAALAGVLAFGARILSLAISRHREELADVSAAELVSPDGIRKALEKLEADHTVVHHVSRATAHLWLVTPLRNEGDDRHAKLNRMFDSHPPLDERIAILRKLEGLDPNERGPVDETITGVPVDLQRRSRSAAAHRPRRAAALTGGLAVEHARPRSRRNVGRRRRAGDDPQAGREPARLVPPRRDDVALLERQRVHRLDRDVERHALGPVATAS